MTNSLKFIVDLKVEAITLNSPNTVIEKIALNNFNVWLQANAYRFKRQMEKMLDEAAWSSYQTGSQIFIEDKGKG